MPQANLATYDWALCFLQGPRLNLQLSMAEFSSPPSRSLCFCCTWCIDLLYSLYWLTNLARLLIFCFVCLGSFYLSATIATLQQAAAIAHENPRRPCKPLLEEHLYNESPEPAPRQKQKLQKAVTHAEGIQKHGMQAMSRLHNEKNRE